MIKLCMGGHLPVARKWVATVCPGVLPIVNLHTDRNVTIIWLPLLQAGWKIPKLELCWEIIDQNWWFSITMFDFRRVLGVLFHLKWTWYYQVPLPGVVLFIITMFIWTLVINRLSRVMPRIALGIEAALLPGMNHQVPGLVNVYSSLWKITIFTL